MHIETLAFEWIGGSSPKQVVWFEGWGGAGRRSHLRWCSPTCADRCALKWQSERHSSACRSWKFSIMSFCLRTEKNWGRYCLRLGHLAELWWEQTVLCGPCLFSRTRNWHSISNSALSRIDRSGVLVHYSAYRVLPPSGASSPCLWSWMRAVCQAMLFPWQQKKSSAVCIAPLNEWKWFIQG